jgi:hypothetical protein
MFRAWKDTILNHYRVLSGKGLKNEKHRFSYNLNLHYSKLFPRLLQPRRRPNAEKFGAIESKGLGLLPSDPSFAKRPPKAPISFAFLGVSVIIGLTHSICQTNRQMLGC